MMNEFMKQMAIQYYNMGFYTDEQFKSFIGIYITQNDYDTTLKAKKDEEKQAQQQNSDTQTTEQGEQPQQ